MKAALFASLLGLIFAGVQLGLMPLASLSVSKSLMGEAYSQGAGGDWMARYTAAMMLGGAFGGIWFGGLGDRIGRARAAGVSVLVYSIFGAAGTLAQTQEQLLLLRFLAGLGVGGMWPNGVALVAESWSNGSRPMVAGIAGTGLNIGIFGVSQMGRWVVVTPDSWRWIFAWSGVSVLLGMLILLALPESSLWIAKGSRKTRTRELFSPELRRRTFIGIAVGAIPIIGAWAASKWMIPWADAVGGAARPGLKALTQQWWSVGAILGSFFGAHLAGLLGRRITYALISFGSVVMTCSIFKWSHPLDASFTTLVFVQGFVTTLFFGWLPLYLPELFPTSVRAGGAGMAYNAGRFISAGCVLMAGAFMAWSGGDYARVGLITGLVYALGLVVIWWAPETKRQSLES
jgi:MFS transporter, SHS family, sialic acid transporter